MERKVITSITLLFKLSLLLITIRIIFRVMGATAVTPFFTWVYPVTTWLLSPFQGIVNNPVIDGTYVFDMVGFFGLVVYGVFLYFFSQITKGVRDELKKKKRGIIIEGEILPGKVMPVRRT